MATMPPPWTLLSFYEIDARELGGDRYFFHNGTNGLGEDVVWSARLSQDEPITPTTYTAFPVEATGFDYSGTGPLPRPSLALANVDQVIGKLARVFRDLKGAKFVRRQTFAQYLDAANFEGGNPEADPEQQFPPDIYIINRKTHEDATVIKFELISKLDMTNARVPARVVSATVCPWIYKGQECGYTGTLPTCDKGIQTANGCEAHFGVGAKLPAGSFPGVGRNRR